jgi:hypothetical protein
MPVLPLEMEARPPRGTQPLLSDPKTEGAHFMNPEQIHIKPKLRKVPNPEALKHLSRAIAHISMAATTFHSAHQPEHETEADLCLTRVLELLKAVSQ